MKKVGIISNESIVKEGIFLGSNRTYLNKDYIDMVLKAGAVPIVIPVITDENVIREIVNMVDGVIITGGEDINPLKYNEEPLPLLGEVSDQRDIADMKILNIALEEGKGVLGICRGCQIINIFFGGTLFQDIQYISNSKLLNHLQKNSRGNPSHKINIEKNSFLYNVFGERELVNSFHHQSIKDVGEKLKVTAKADDGVIEAIEGSFENLVIGVQWHPEMMKENKDMINLFKMFIDCLK